MARRWCSLGMCTLTLLVALPLSIALRVMIEGATR